MKHLCITSCLLMLLCSTAPLAAYNSVVTSESYEKIRNEYGRAAESRLKQWQQIITDEQDSTEWHQSNKINKFFNKSITYKNDLHLWGKKDYWASPTETISRGQGDCEDYAIAKFFSLIALGVSEDKLRLMYVRHLKVNEPHMVLIYFETPQSIPWVLDNYHPKILPANKRPDLKPIYSFNGKGLWMAKAKGLGRKVHNSMGNSAWDDLKRRIEAE